MNTVEYLFFSRKIILNLLPTVFEFILIYHPCPHPIEMAPDDMPDLPLLLPHALRGHYHTRIVLPLDPSAAEEFPPFQSYHLLCFRQVRRVVRIDCDTVPLKVVTRVVLKAEGTLSGGGVCPAQHPAPYCFVASGTPLPLGERALPRIVKHRVRSSAHGEVKRAFVHLRGGSASP